jgi:hypothetical protein
MEFRHVEEEYRYTDRTLGAQTQADVAFRPNQSARNKRWNGAQSSAESRIRSRDDFLSLP